jgi:hypothetical protein
MQMEIATVIFINMVALVCVVAVAFALFLLATKVGRALRRIRLEKKERQEFQQSVEWAKREKALRHPTVNRRITTNIYDSSYRPFQNYRSDCAVSGGAASGVNFQAPEHLCIQEGFVEEPALEAVHSGSFYSPSTDCGRSVQFVKAKNVFDVAQLQNGKWKDLLTCPECRAKWEKGAASPSQADSGTASQT